MDVFEEIMTPHKCDVLCDICGKSCREGSYDVECASLLAYWGYGSPYDTQQHRCDMCVTCYERVLTFIRSIGGHVQIDNYRSTGLEE